MVTERPSEGPEPLFDRWGARASLRRESAVKGALQRRRYAARGSDPFKSYRPKNGGEPPRPW